MIFLIIAGYAESLVNFRTHLILKLQSLNYDVHVIAPNIEKNSAIYKTLVEMNLTVHTIPLSRAGVSSVGDLIAIIKLIALLRRIKPVVVLSYTIKPVIYGSIAALVTGVPHRFALITGLGYAFQDENRGTFLYDLVTRLYKFSLHKITNTIFHNPDDRNLFYEEGILENTAPSVVVNGSGVDLDKFRKSPMPNEAFQFLLIARLIGDKGVREYVEAAKIVRRSHGEVNFFLAGWIDDNPNAISPDELAQWIQNGDVKYLGKLTDVFPALTACTVYVLPSYREGTPRTVLEAMAVGRPIITTDAPGCRETVINGVNGLLVKVKSAESLAKAMVELIEKPELLSEMSKNSRQIAETKYSVERITEAMIDAMSIASVSNLPRVLLTSTIPDTFTAILANQPAFLSKQFKIAIATCDTNRFSDIRKTEKVITYPVRMSRNISLFKDIYSVFSMIKVIRHFEPVLVHSYTPKAGLVSMLAAWICRVPIRVHTFTGLIFPTETGIKRRVLIIVDRIISFCATHVIPESQGVKRDLLQFHITKKPLSVIGHGNIAGVDTTFFSRCNPNILKLKQPLYERESELDDSFVFCFVGRLNKDKGLRELKDAFLKLPDRARLILLGDIDETAPVDGNTLSFFQMHPRVNHLGFQSDIRPFLVCSHTLVLPSYREGFPNVLLQAGSMELPVISTDVSGATDLIQPNFNGWIVPTHDVVRLANAMSFVMNLPKSQREAIGRNARHRVASQYEKQDHLNRISELYLQLFNNLLKPD